MDVTVQTYQAFLDDAWDAAPATANSLRDQLRTFERAATRLFSAGSLASVAKNSASQAYRGPGIGSYTPVQIANVWRDLINLFDEEKIRIDAALAGGEAADADDDDQPDDTDESVYNAMRQRLLVITEYQVDVSEIRLHPTLSNGVQTW